MVGSRRTITGETLAPRLPATAAVLAAGEIGTGQLRVITETIAALPASVPPSARERVEADLAGYARDFDPRRLRIIAQRLVATLDPDGPRPARTVPRRHHCAASCGCGTAATAGWDWRAGSMPSTAPWSAP